MPYGHSAQKAVTDGQAGICRVIYHRPPRNPCTPGADRSGEMEMDKAEPIKLASVYARLLLGRCPATPTLRTRQNRYPRHVSPLTRSLTGQPSLA